MCFARLRVLTALIACAAAVALPPSLVGGTLPANVTEGYVKAEDDIYLFARKIGSGPNVIIVPLQLFLYETFRSLAAADRTLIFYDVRNRGQSTPVGDDLKIGIQRDVADIDVIRQAFGVTRFSLIGFSYGGLMVALYAMDHPDRVERLVQLGPVPPMFPTEYRKEYMPDDADRVPEPAGLAALRDLRQQGVISADPRGYCERDWAVSRFALVGDPAHVDRLGIGPCSLPNEWPLNFNRHLRIHFNSIQNLAVHRDRFTAIQQPVLVVHGKKDRNAPYGAGREWSWLLPNGRLLTVPGAAHESWIDEPNLVLPAVDEFLRGRWPPRAEKVTASPYPY